MRTLFIVLALSLLLTSAAFAQTSSGSIAGSVVDAQNAVVVNATVTVVEQEKKRLTDFRAKLDDIRVQLARLA